MSFSKIKSYLTKFISTTKPSDQQISPPIDLNVDAATVAVEPTVTQEKVQEPVMSVPETVSVSHRLPLLTIETKNIYRKIDKKDMFEIRETLDLIYITYAKHSTIVEDYRMMLAQDAIATSIAKGIFINQIEDEFDMDVIMRRLLAFVAIITSVKITDTFLEYNPYSIISAVGPTLKDVFEMDTTSKLKGDVQAAVLYNVVHNAAFTTRPSEPILAVAEICAFLQLNADNTAMLIRHMLHAVETKALQTH